ncbi:hypothetical protein [Bradyrhizobium sp. 170]|uniref:hypothetical protein n=1 Tax=Bradyrhizobium sp. 170 TaxID=2782641 RepID=UPI00200055E9|nr:hypothetical protein [Bradyrhizobium sp. 170]UPK03051.1 hypothetical protein IVB05_36830 [Bradyrhizobium sp. 170]
MSIRNGIIITAIIGAGLLWYGGAFEPSQPKKPDAQYGDTIAANVATVGCDTEEAADKAAASCIAIPMAATGKAIKTYGKRSICVRWQGVADCLWSPRESLLFIPAESTSK